MKHKYKIAELLHSIFGESAIQAGAICEQLEDIKYCTEHNMNYLNGGHEKTRWEKAMKMAETLAEKDKTFSVENIKKFQKAVNEFLRNNPESRLYEGLSETEHFAVRRFYYFNSY